MLLSRTSLAAAALTVALGALNACASVRTLLGEEAIIDLAARHSESFCHQELEALRVDGCTFSAYQDESGMWQVRALGRFVNADGQPFEIGGGGDIWLTFSATGELVSTLYGR